MDSKQSVSSSSDHLAVSFVPAPIRELYLNDPERQAGASIEPGYSVLLWVDIVHFSSMCNRLVGNKEFGVEKLTSILQNHYDLILDLINAYGGQPLFFAGDGLMSAWGCATEDATDTVKRVVDCAKRILNERKTIDDQGEVLSLHTIISAGSFEMKEFGFIKEKTLASFSGEVFTRLVRTAKNRAVNQLLISKEAKDFIAHLGEFEEVEHQGFILHTIEESSPPESIQTAQFSEAAVQKMKSYVPLTLTFPLNKERLKWVAEIRPVTILFLTILNSDEDAQYNLAQLPHTLSLIMPSVNKYEALINQVWLAEKDFNMLICFGPPPSSHVDNSERGVKLAMEVQDILKKNNILISAGVSTEKAFCGILGNDHLRQYTVIGDVVNLSARLAENVSFPIFCDKTTFQASRTNILFDDPELISIKGFPGLTPVYKPQSVNSDVPIKKFSQISVGRQEELKRLLVGISDAAKDKSCFFLIEGEAGMGKSSLLIDLMNRLASDQIPVHTGTCDFVQRNSPYSAFKPLIESLLDIDQSSLNNHFLDEVLNRFGEKACLLNIVLNISLPDSDWVKSLALSQRVIATHDFILELLTEQATKGPLVLIVDNAHWIDNSSWALFNSIQQQLSGVLVLLAFLKTEGLPQVQMLVNNGAQRLLLEPLSDKGIEALACSRLGVSAISKDLSALIRKVSKGNPFFCIEFIGSLFAQDLLLFENNQATFRADVDMNNLSLPESVRSVIRGRIDKLGHGSQLALKVGSVVGARFAEKIISSIYPITQDRNLVSSYLGEVEQYGFLNESVVDNLSGYQFNNETTKDVSYEMTLLDQRRQLHRQSAEWYELHFKQNLFPFYRRLASHWSEADENEKAAHYFELEAIRIFQLGYAKDALDVGLKAVEMLGLELPRELPEIQQQLSENFGAIMQANANRPIADWVDNKPMTDERMVKLIKLLLLLSPIAHQCQQGELFALFSIICQKLTMENGNSDDAAEVFAMFSIIYKVFTDDTEGAYQWSTLSLEVDKTKGLTRQSRVLFIHCWFIALWKNPLRSLIPLADEGANKGLETGDILYGCFNLSLNVVLKCVAGNTLKEVRETAEAYYLRNNQKVLNAAFHLIMEAQMAKALEGSTIGPLSLTDEKMNEERDVASICKTDLYNQIAYYFIGKLKLNVHYGHWADAVDWGNKALPLLPAFMNQPGQIELVQYHTIALLYMAGQTEGEESKTMQQTANAGIDKMKAWANVCPENFGHKAAMAEAIRDALQGNDLSEGTFIAAAESARKQGFLQDCGLAYEQLGRSLHNRGMKTDNAVSLAIQAYTEWGATAKVRYLSTLFVE